jgi:hypothetical protein
MKFETFADLWAYVTEQAEKKVKNEEGKGHVDG